MIKMNRTTWVWMGRKGINVLKVFYIENKCVRVSLNYNRVKISEKIQKILNKSSQLEDAKSVEFTILESELEALIDIVERKVSNMESGRLKLSIVVWPSGDYVYTRRAVAVLKPFVPSDSIVTEM